MSKFSEAEKNGKISPKILLNVIILLIQFRGKKLILYIILKVMMSLLKI